MDVSLTCLEHSCNSVIELARGISGAYVCVSNVHMCMETFDSEIFCDVVNNSNLVIPDGKPIALAQKLLGHREAKQVRGEDIMAALCEASGKENLRIGLYGGTSEIVLENVKSSLLASYPDINIDYAFCPPFRCLTKDEDDSVVNDIQRAEIDILFLGIGCPKQEYWMAEHKKRLNCVMLGVGAAFDFIAGSKNHAPRWMQRIGLEWFFRLCSEPRRLWKRYLKQNPRFIYYLSQQLFLGRRF